MICFFFLCVAAKHHRMSQPRGPQRLTLPAGRHGGTSVHAAAGERGANGRHSGAQRPARGAAWRGPRYIFLSLSLPAGTVFIRLPFFWRLFLSSWLDHPLLLVDFPPDTRLCHCSLVLQLTFYCFKALTGANGSVCARIEDKMIPPLCCMLASVSLIPL